MLTNIFTQAAQQSGLESWQSKLTTSLASEVWWLLGMDWSSPCKDWLSLSPVKIDHHNCKTLQNSIIDSAQKKILTSLPQNSEQIPTQKMLQISRHSISQHAVSHVCSVHILTQSFWFQNIHSGFGSNCVAKCHRVATAFLHTCN